MTTPNRDSQEVSLRSGLGGEEKNLSKSQASEPVPNTPGCSKAYARTDPSKVPFYVVPFHAHAAIETLSSQPSLAVGPKPIQLAMAQDLRQGAVLETTFRMGKGQNPGSLSLNLLHDGVVLKDAEVSLGQLREGQEVRVIHKIPLILNKLALEISAISGESKIEELSDSTPRSGDQPDARDHGRSTAPRRSDVRSLA